MLVFKRLIALAALAAAMLLVNACERKITRVEVTEGPQTCFSCHSDQNTFLVAREKQWEYSVHASGGTLNENSRDCKNCHTSEGYVARAETCTPHTVNDGTTIDNPTEIHCFTCHAPHTNGNFHLRWMCTTTLMNGTTFDLHKGNLCASCHQARTSVLTMVTSPTTKLTTRWGPHHGPQSDMLIGTNGYEYAGFTYEQTHHATATTQDTMSACIECHMSPSSLPYVGGHSWNMSYDEGGSEVLNTSACAGCHGSISDFNEITLNGSSVQDSVDALVATLQTDLLNAGLLSPSGSEVLPTNNMVTSADSAGAVWNYLMVSNDRSSGVHNAKYILGLLTSSIEYIEGTLPAPVPLARASAGPRR